MAFKVPRHASLPYLLAVPAGGLLLAYLYAWVHRPEYPVQYAVEDPTTYEYPGWFNSTPSPYDAKPVELAEEVDVVIWIDLPYDSPNVAQALSTVKALQWAPSVSVRPISTLGSSWNSSLDATQNLEGFGCGKWIWRIAEQATDSQACPGAIWVSEILPRGFNVFTTLAERHDARANIELLSRPQELFEPESSYTSLKAHFGDAWKLGFLSHVMPFADPAIYYPSSRVNRKSVTFFPSSFTPRDHWPSVPWGPGWRLYKPKSSKPPFQPGQDTFAENSKYRLFWEAAEHRKSQAMRSSGICIACLRSQGRDVMLIKQFEGWETGVLTLEMAQAMLSGCVVAMAPPQVHHDILSPLILTLPKSAFQPGKIPTQAISNAQVQTTDAQMKLKSLRGFIVARQLLTVTGKINSVKELVKTWQDGARGYNLPHAFKWNCDSVPRPSWC